MIITIDGPAGSGKSTVARMLATELDFSFLDTGAMYRSVGWYALNRSLEEEKDVIEALPEFQFKMEQGKVLVNDEDVTKQIRNSAVTEKASLVAMIPEVRELLVDLQREFAKGKNIVSEGRDQGTIVFPDAEFKFFLTASVEKRALRRLNDSALGGEVQDVTEIEQQIRERDLRDSTRESAPMRAADDATVVDTSDMEIDEVVSKLKEIVLEGSDTE